MATEPKVKICGVTRAEDARRQGPKLASELTRDLSDYVQQRWQVSSRLELEFEKLYLKLFLPSVRGGAAPMPARTTWAPRGTRSRARRSVVISPR